MSKTRDTGFLGNVVKVDASGNVSFVSGSTTLATINTSGQLSGSSPVLSASYASNAELLDGLDSTVFTLTSSFNAQTASFTAFSASILTYTSSANNRFSSIETVTGSNITRLNALEAATGSLYSYTSSLNNKTASFATTGSNTFIGTQTISGSVLQSGSFTTTGTIIAQTINVQQVTSSIIYSSGSNIFGNLLGDSQKFTGSVLITGSLTIAAGGNASAPTIFGSTIACSPIGCFATSCATSFIGGTMSGTTIYGSTAVCSPVGKFTTCIDAGSGIFSSSVTAGTGGYLISGDNHIRLNNTVSQNQQIQYQNNGTTKFQLYLDYATNGFSIYNSAQSANNFTIASTGAATFACQVNAESFYTNDTRYISNQIMSGYNANSEDSDIWINYTGYLGGTTRFRDFRIGNGKQGQIALFDGSTGAATFACSVQACTNISAGTYLGVSRNGSDTIGSGPYLVLSQTSNSRQWIQQMGASLSLDFYHYNGSAWIQPLILAASGDITIACNVRVGGVLTVAADTNGYQIKSADYDFSGGWREMFRVSHIGLTTSGRFTLNGTGNSFVHSSQWAWSSTHNGGNGRGRIIQLTGGEYSDIQFALDITGAGDIIISANFGTSYTLNLFIEKVRGGAIDTSNQNADRTSAPSGYFRVQTITSTPYGSQFYRLVAEILGGSGNRALYSDANGVLTNSSSDVTLKKNVENITYGLNSIMALRPISFNWIPENLGEQKEIGFIAQEVQELIPEVIGINNDETLSLDYPKLTAVLVKAIQELKSEINELKAQING